MFSFKTKQPVLVHGWPPGYSEPTLGELQRPQRCKFHAAATPLAYCIPPGTEVLVVVNVSRPDKLESRRSSLPSHQHPQHPMVDHHFKSLSSLKYNILKSRHFILLVSHPIISPMIFMISLVWCCPRCLLIILKPPMFDG